jgi:hypothetical protein
MTFSTEELTEEGIQGTVKLAPVFCHPLTFGVEWGEASLKDAVME